MTQNEIFSASARRPVEVGQDRGAGADAVASEQARQARSRHKHLALLENAMHGIWQQQPSRELRQLAAHARREVTNHLCPFAGASLAATVVAVTRNDSSGPVTEGGTSSSKDK